MQLFNMLTAPAAPPVARTRSDILCLALYTLTGGRPLQGKAVKTIADWLELDGAEVHAAAEATHRAGLVRLDGDIVSLTEKGQARGVALRPPRPQSVHATA